MKRRGVQEGFGPEAFEYHEESDTFTCPSGNTLNYEGLENRAGVTHYRYRSPQAQCEACPLKSKCCPDNTKGRSVTRSVEAPEGGAFRVKMQTDAAQEIYKLRGKVAEFSNAWIKEKLGLRRFHVRGMAKVAMELLWVCMTYDIQQWIRLRWLPRQAASVAA